MRPEPRTSVAGKSPFGTLLLQFRTRRGLTQEGLAQATGSNRISPRSITNYEKSAANPRDWILPHRPGLRSLSSAMALDPVEERALADAWTETRALKEARTLNENAQHFVTEGRETILATILEAWDRARQGLPQLVLLGGDSGIGKSAIAWHICDTIAASTREVMITWGEAHSWAPPVEPYLAIRHATDRMLVPPPTSYTLPGLYPNRPSLNQEIAERVFEAIPQLGGALISESTLRQLAISTKAITSRSIESLLESHAATESFGRWDEYTGLLADITQHWPIVMVLEDMHWASGLSCSLLQHLAHHLGNRTDVPLLILCTYRSHELLPRQDDSPHPFGQFLQQTSHLANVSSIHMHETLLPDHGISFVRGYLATMPMDSPENHDELVEWLFQRTAGQPMMIVETVRHLRDAGALVLQPNAGSWRFLPKKAPKEIPPAITILIAERMAPIDRRSRFVLEVASALGETLVPEVIALVTNMDEETLLDLLDTVLVERHEMLAPGSVISLSHRTHQTYYFPHAHLREYIYNEMRPARRRRIHLDIAEAISRTFAYTDATAMGEITHHLVKAEDWHSAQLSAYRLAQLMTGRLDWELASVWFDHAEQLALRAEDPQQLWRARAARLVVMRGRNLYDEGLALGKRVLHQATLHNWRATLGLAHHHIGEMYYDLGKLELAVEHIQLAHDIHEQEHAYDLAAAAQAMLSHATHRQGKYDVAREYARRSLAYSQELHNSWVRSEAMLAAANCDMELGFYDNAIDSYRAAIEIASMSGKLSNQLLPSINIGLAFVMLGRYEDAINEIVPSLSRMKTHPRLKANGQLYLGMALERSGELEAALQAFQESADVRRRPDPVPALYDTLAGMLSVYIRLGDHAAMRKHLGEIESHIDRDGVEGMEDPCLALLTVARAYEVLGDRERYIRRLEQAHSLVMQRAARIKDAEASESYLNHVPANVEIRNRYKELHND